MEHIAKWRLLDHGQDDLPTLILHSSIGQDGYSIQLSDLNDIWFESLDRKQLCKRANQLGCSIDPTEDGLQYDIFIKTLHKALLQQQDTSLQIESGSNQRVVIRVEALLPKPLVPLCWEVLLEKSEAALLRSELVEPLLNEVHHMREQRSMVFAEIAAKDHVIARMADRLEASGTLLAEIFPDVANLPGARRHGTSREKLAQHVRGLGVFNSDAWQAQQHQTALPELKADTITEVLQYLPDPRTSTTTETTTQWWKRVDVKLGGLPYATLATVASSIPMDSEAEVIPSKLSLEDSDTDDFQQQHVSQDAGNQSSTDDEIEVKKTPTKRAAPAKESTPQAERAESPVADDRKDTSFRPQTHAPKRKLGAIGGHSKALPDPPAEARNPDTSPLPETKMKSKLGAICGKVNNVPQSDLPQQASDRSEPSKTLSDAPPPAMPSRHKTPFTVGGRKAAVRHAPGEAEKAEENHNQIKAEPDANGVDGQQTLKEEEPEEVRADHKRDELKRQLEQKNKMPVKKKRKF